MFQNHLDQPFVTIGIDVRNGSPTQVAANFRQRVKTTYPLLLEGSGVARLYGVGYEDLMVVDHEGIIRYRPENFGSSLKTAQRALEEALTRVPKPETESGKAPDSSQDGLNSWGAVKQVLRP